MRGARTTISRGAWLAVVAGCLVGIAGSADAAAHAAHPARAAHVAKRAGHARHELAVPAGPSGAAFYAPPESLVAGGPAGTPVWQRPAVAPVALPQAAATVDFIYRSVSVLGSPNVDSASLMVPKGTPPAGGWPTVVWNHITTGSADICAPSEATPGSTELNDMTLPDPMLGLLLSAGIAVVRPDDEGIGTPGPHPYLMGPSLGRSAVDAMRAARLLDPALSRRYALAGHSEGGIAALFAGQLAPRLAPDLDLRGVVAAAPPSNISLLMKGLAFDPVAGAGTSSLAGLILAGAAAADPHLWTLYRDGGLSAQALALMPDVERRCFNDLSKNDSWGGIAPDQIPGPNAGPAEAELYPLIDESDPKTVRIPRDIPISLYQGMLDAPVPFPFTAQLANTLQSNGMDVALQLYPTATHPTLTDLNEAGPAIAAWLEARLR